MSDTFLSPRTCFLAPIPELDEAADLLSQAADCLLEGNVVLARGLIKQADLPAVRTYASSVMGRVSTDIHRYRAVADIPSLVARTDRAKVRRLKPSEEMDVFARDGYRCRYCACRVMVTKARKVMMLAAPDELQWGNADKSRHAAFYALTAVADHVVPHARGGTSEPSNLITTCQSCNYGKGDSLIAQFGLIDPWTRPAIRDRWDGLSRLLQQSPRSQIINRNSADGTGCAGTTPGATIQKFAPTEKLPQAEWFAELDRSRPKLSTRLMALLTECEGFNVTWALKDYLIIRMRVGNARLAILGINRNGDVEVPWAVTGHKNKYRPFAYALERAIPGARAYEREKMWRVNKDGRKLTLSELLDASPALKTAIEDLHAALKD